MTTDHKMIGLSAELLARRKYMSMLGQSYGGKRDIYEALGYPKDLTAEDYFLRYKRQDIAKRIINAPVNGCWGQMPQILESTKRADTPFEAAFLELNKRAHLLRKLIRLDKLCGLGRYSVLFFGYDGYQQDQLAMELDQRQHNLLYVTPFGETAAKIVEWEQDATKPNYGLPKLYELTMRAIGNAQKSVRVHATRCVHVTEGLLDNDVYGTPRLESVYNRLMDIEKLVGGSGEMFWQGAFPGFAMKADPEMDMEDSAAETTAEMDSYMHQIRRYMRLQGVDVQQLTPQVEDPGPHISVQLDMISADTGIPKRILIGSERGELASGQDSDNWNEKLAQRRVEHCTDTILRPVVDKLIADQVLPEPSEGYEVDWPSLYSQSDEQRAEIARKRAEALSKYSTQGIDMLMSFDAYLEHVCGYEPEVVELMVNSQEFQE